MSSPADSAVPAAPAPKPTSVRQFRDDSFAKRYFEVKYPLAILAGAVGAAALIIHRRRVTGQALGQRTMEARVVVQSVVLAGLTAFMLHHATKDKDEK